ncbi:MULTISPECIES: VOC family protein [Rhodomicrobium]|uniref:VOC family protein n=1 Tax=Rhodomicrobium TaxID=1068 RepID=UPI000B4B3588|nr:MULTISPECIES: VOC family protein [Rhodomicrobium]
MAKTATARKPATSRKPAAPSKKSEPVPVGQIEVKGGAVPYLNVDGAVKAAEFYAKAFGAREVGRHPVDEKGRTMHIHLYINGSSVMLCDFYPEHGFPKVAPQAFNIHMKVDDVEAAWKRAVDAGAEITLPLQDMFWGDRYGQVRDPFGVIWSMGAPSKKDA